MDKSTIYKAFKQLHQSIWLGIQAEDSSANKKEIPWNRQQGGGGLSCLIEGGKIIEKGGVNIAEVFGSMDKSLKKILKIDDSQFYATGISIVIHPFNPFVPIIHMNIRYFQTQTEYWFGGGMDLTPHYVSAQEAKNFHLQLKSICDAHNKHYYPQFKAWADEYFYLPHRQECRGIGGIFFDKLKPENKGEGKEDIFNFVLDIGKNFLAIYSPLISNNAQKPYCEQQKQWQYQRRSRYVEFNLMYDRGTLFGFKSKGRIDSILMSLPPLTSWSSISEGQMGQEELKTMFYLKNKKQWIE